MRLKAQGGISGGVFVYIDCATSVDLPSCRGKATSSDRVWFHLHNVMDKVAFLQPFSRLKSSMASSICATKSMKHRNWNIPSIDGRNHHIQKHQEASSSDPTLVYKAGRFTLLIMHQPKPTHKPLRRAFELNIQKKDHYLDPRTQPH